jgi:hypothetical protein
MEHDLGFRIGPGHQSYQFDTLPIACSSVSELERGDLIFYSATYASSTAMPLGYPCHVSRALHDCLAQDAVWYAQAPAIREFLLVRPGTMHNGASGTTKSRCAGARNTTWSTSKSTSARARAASAPGPPTREANGGFSFTTTTDSKGRPTDIVRSCAAACGPVEGGPN